MSSSERQVGRTVGGTPWKIACRWLYAKMPRMSNFLFFTLKYILYKGAICKVVEHKRRTTN
jgi:hypothetical protein